VIFHVRNNGSDAITTYVAIMMKNEMTFVSRPCKREPLKYTFTKSSLSFTTTRLDNRRGDKAKIVKLRITNVHAGLL